MTEDERLVLSTTIALHGFDLYERLMKDGVWRPLIVGRVVAMNGNQPLHEAVVQWIDDDRINPRRSRLPWTHTWQRHHWFKLTDQQLQAFHDTVVSTC